MRAIRERAGHSVGQSSSLGLRFPFSISNQEWGVIQCCEWKTGFKGVLDVSLA